MLVLQNILKMFSAKYLLKRILPAINSNRKNFSRKILKPVRIISSESDPDQLKYASGEHRKDDKFFKSKKHFDEGFSDLIVNNDSGIKPDLAEIKVHQQSDMDYKFFEKDINLFRYLGK